MNLIANVTGSWDGRRSREVNGMKLRCNINHTEIPQIW
jgi:hypothetical protein